MGGDEQRDHILFNIGLRSLDSATIVFKNPFDGNKLYKYLAQDVSIEKAGYMRTDGWCIPDDETGDWAILVSDETLSAETMDKDNKYLFNLIDDVAEENNLMISAENEDITQQSIDYAISLITPYMDHPYFSEAIDGLWDYDSNEDDGV